MTKIKQTITITKRVKKGVAQAGYHPCPSCGGTGLKKNVGRGAKKK